MRAAHPRLIHAGEFGNLVHGERLVRVENDQYAPFGNGQPVFFVEKLGDRLADPVGDDRQPIGNEGLEQIG